MRWLGQWSVRRFQAMPGSLSHYHRASGVRAEVAGAIAHNFRIEFEVAPCAVV
ncbi:hypothetical protein [Streptomyces violascens]|uniref:hypothetical protein n=1 Tax=Streptomyces violascens TaxID=67381 RepID=UPI00368B1AE7